MGPGGFQLLLMCAMAASPPSARAEEPPAGGLCFPDWTEAASIVQREKLLPVEQLTAGARSKLKGEIVKTTLCDQGAVMCTGSSCGAAMDSLQSKPSTPKRGMADEPLV